jgi:hypothetical protein
MRIPIDECIDERYRNSFFGHDCQTVRYAGLDVAFPISSCAPHRHSTRNSDHSTFIPPIPCLILNHLIAAMLAFYVFIFTQPRSVRSKPRSSSSPAHESAGPHRAVLSPFIASSLLTPFFSWTSALFVHNRALQPLYNQLLAHSFPSNGGGSMVSCKSLPTSVGQSTLGCWLSLVFIGKR